MTSSRDNLDFATAEPVERGCGKRKPGGFYLECGMGPNGLPLEHFLVDPPQPLPENLGNDIVNKPKLWQDPATKINHALIWVGAQHYPYVGDFIEEVRKFGASRRIPSTFPFAELGPHSRMIFVHPKARNKNWANQIPPEVCPKEKDSHLFPAIPNEDAVEMMNGEVGRQQNATSRSNHLVVLVGGKDVEREKKEENNGSNSQLSLDLPLDNSVNRKSLSPEHGPCLGKTYNLIPAKAAANTVARGADPYTGKMLPPICIRKLPSLQYTYIPHEEDATKAAEALAALEPGIFMWLPITCVAYVKNPEETEESQKRLEKTRDRIAKSGLNFYEADE